MILRHFSVLVLLLQIWVCNSEIQQKSQTLQASSWTCHAVGSYKYDSSITESVVILPHKCYCSLVIQEELYILLFSTPVCFLLFIDLLNCSRIIKESKIMLQIVRVTTILIICTHGKDGKNKACPGHRRFVMTLSNYLFPYRKRQMTAAAFSGDGSVLAVAAETVITLWNPDKNVLLAVVGETHTVIYLFAYIFML